ncbi:MAG: NMD3-related protein [Nanoarchaeota archaeon]|nr:NMD3-related protein [Nanoarchaeota archaeon]
MKLPRSDYFQGILQLRDINDEIVSFVHNQIKKRGDVAVTRNVKFSNGIDLYITSQKFIRILGKKLKDSFGGELKISAKLHTRNKQGKDLYRVNVLFRLSKYKKGDIVSVRGDEVRLISLGRKIFAKNVKTGKKVTIRSKELFS